MDNSHIMKPLFLASVLWCKVVIVFGDVHCGGSYSSNYGEISSPNYPDEYPNKANCTWTIEGGVDTRLVIVFIFSDLTPFGFCNDYVEISEGSNILFTRCEQFPEQLITSGRTATIHFVSNFASTGKGFKLFWKAFTAPLLKRFPMSWKEAFATCMEDFGSLEPGNSFDAKYSGSISSLMIDHNITEIWMRAFFTPWLWLKGCFRTSTKLPGIFFKDNQAAVCQDVCSEHNYFGLQGNMCYCLNKTLGEYTESKVHCVFSCPGNDQEVCGGKHALTIYKNEKSSTNGPFPCIALQNVNDSVIGRQLDCNTKLTAICEYIDETSNKKLVLSSSPLSWTAARQYCLNQAYSADSMLGSSSEMNHSSINKNALYWTGYSRGVSTGVKNICTQKQPFFKQGPTDRQTDCIKLQRNGNQLNPVATKCTDQLPFVCGKVPVNCGKNFVENESYFRYPPDGSNYSNDMNCEWKIVGIKDTYIRLEVFYEIESCNDCNCDSLKVYEGAKQQQKISHVKTFCGYGNETFNSATKDVTLVFRSDRTVHSKGVSVKWKSVPFASKSTTTEINARTSTADASSIHMLSTVSHKKGHEKAVNNNGKRSVGLVVGVVIATLLAVSLVIVCIVVIRRKRNKRNEAIGNSLEMNSVEASTAHQLQSNNHEYAIVSKKIIRKAEMPCQQTNASILTMKSSAFDGSYRERSERNREAEEYSTVYTENRSMINATDTRTNITFYSSSFDKGNENHLTEEGTLEDTDYSYNVLNQDTSNTPMPESENVYNHVQATANDAYDCTTCDLMKSDSNDTYSHVR